MIVSFLIFRESERERKKERERELISILDVIPSIDKTIKLIYIHVQRAPGLGILNASHKEVKCDIPDLCLLTYFYVDMVVCA